MDLLAVFFGLFVVGVALFKRELLVDPQSLQVILWLSVVSFILGIALHFTEFGADALPGMLLMPLLSLGLYRGGRRIFIRIFNREPRDTFMDWRGGMAADRAFNVLFFVGSIWLGLLTAAGMSELAERGW